MNQQQSSKQSIIIGALSGALVLSIGTSAFFYFQSKNQPQAISQEKTSEESKALPFPSNETALKELFGVSDPSGKVKTAPDKLTNFWFEQSIKNGTDNIHVKFFATQSLDESGQPVDAHASGVDVGVITYKQNSGQWEVISKQPQFGVAGSWGKVDEVKPEILQLSPTSLAVMLDASGGMGGWFDEGKTIFVFAQNSWHDVGYVQTGGDNSGTCDENEPPEGIKDGVGPCYSYKGTISVVNGSTSEYPDLLVTRTGTESKEHRGALIPAKNVMYVFKDGKYINPNEPQ